MMRRSRDAFEGRRAFSRPRGRRSSRHPERRGGQSQICGASPYGGGGTMLPSLAHGSDRPPRWPGGTTNPPGTHGRGYPRPRVPRQEAGLHLLLAGDSAGFSTRTTRSPRRGGAG
ncbi:hypothetical protein PVAP13_8KG101492 [Panicum virgatum]|uniref:Uncharacterized protein n=1 Tax=Panicum virgatum TaxID=38727 RepID=A0A8T0PE55_PANVG|nr:hypothetical protein PVAP13_8KG101492 [Panicum virgatum]